MLAHALVGAGREVIGARAVCDVGVHSGQNGLVSSPFPLGRTGLPPQFSPMARGGRRAAHTHR